MKTPRRRYPRYLPAGTTALKGQWVAQTQLVLDTDGHIGGYLGTWLRNGVTEHDGILMAVEDVDWDHGPPRQYRALPMRKIFPSP